MANSHSSWKPEDQQPAIPTQGKSFQFINEQERQQDPKSHLRTIVRSNAKKHDHFTRRISRFPSRSFRKLVKAPGTAAAFKSSTHELEVTSFQTASEGSIKVGVNGIASTGTKRNRQRRISNTAQFRSSNRIRTESSSICITRRSIRPRASPVFHNYQTEPPRRGSVPRLQLPHGVRTPSGQIRENGEEVLSHHQISPRTILGAGRVDPFNSYPVEVKPYMHSVMDHYSSVCCWSRPTEPGTGLTTLHTQWIPLCMKNEMAFKSLLLASNASLRGNFGLDPWCSTSIQLIVDCVELLSKEISDTTGEISDVMFATVINLAGIELVWGDHAKYQNHIRGLNQMVKIRGGLDKGLSSFMRCMIIWVIQIGMGIAVNNVAVAQDQEDISRYGSASRGSSSVLRDLVELFKSIRFLSTAQTTINTVSTGAKTADYQAACLHIQNQLESLLPTTAASTIEQCCIFSGFIFIDLILLRTPAVKILTSRINRQLQRSLWEMKSSQNSKANRNITSWISATAVAALGSGAMKSSRLARLVDSFNKALLQMEAWSSL